MTDTSQATATVTITLTLNAEDQASFDDLIDSGIQELQRDIRMHRPGCDRNKGSEETIAFAGRLTRLLRDAALAAGPSAKETPAPSELEQAIAECQELGLPGSVDWDLDKKAAQRCRAILNGWSRQFFKGEGDTPVVALRAAMNQAVTRGGAVGGGGDER